jgi:hypothetical protein
MNTNKIGICATFLFLIGLAIYFATRETPDNSRPVPAVQKEGQVMGIGVQAGMRVNAGTPLDCQVKTHFWTPGLDVSNDCTPTVTTPHRYPAIPGGNTSTIMHKGWSAFGDSTPDNGWFLNPPEVAIL